jgi:hypothetical protein
MSRGWVARALVAVSLAGCVATASAEFGGSTLGQLQQLNHKPELYLNGPQGDFLITPDTRVEIFLTGGEVVTAYATQILTTGNTVVLKNQGATFSLSDVARVRYTSKY